jgi:hypothetical protein
LELYHSSDPVLDKDQQDLIVLTLMFDQHLLNER